MVSKVAVVALVAIFAVPILLGYALNLSEVTVNEYKQDGSEVNVTGLLQSDVAYTSAKADIYRMNTVFTRSSLPIKPVYESIGSAYSSLPLYQYAKYLYYQGHYFWLEFRDITSDLYVYIGADKNITMAELTDTGNTTLHDENRVIDLYYNYADNLVEYNYQMSNGVQMYGSYTVADTNTSWLFFRNDSTTPAYVYYSGTFASNPNNYVDLAAGYHFVNVNYVKNRQAVIELPNDTESILMTVNLDSITDSNYSVVYGIGRVYIELQKTTTNGVSSWKAIQLKSIVGGLQQIYETDLYYNPSGNNTYQIVVESGLTNSSWHTELRYIGSWPTLIGAANYYIRYSFDWEGELSNYFGSIDIGHPVSGNILATTPIMRLDDATIKGFSYGIISNQSYNPVDFKANPTTTLSVQKAGLSLVFGGNTYNVDKSGNITLGTHKVSTNGLVLESIPAPGGYANKINGYTISTTPQPSTIVFNGDWGASVSTVGNVQSSYTHTEWTPGEFAWDGLDQNFLMIGMLAALGVFIALGIAFRKVKSALFALLVVCGGAVLLFFTML